MIKLGYNVFKNHKKDHENVLMNVEWKCMITCTIKLNDYDKYSVMAWMTSALIND